MMLTRRRDQRHGGPCRRARNRGVAFPRAPRYVGHRGGTALAVSLRRSRLRVADRRVIDLNQRTRVVVRRPRLGPALLYVRVRRATHPAPAEQPISAGSAVAAREQELRARLEGFGTGHEEAEGIREPIDRVEREPDCERVLDLLA